MAKVIPLDFVALFMAQKIELILIFDAFGNDFQFQGVRQSDDGSGDRGLFRVGRDISHKRLVDFQLIDGKVLQAAQAGVAGAKIVKREFQAQAMKLAHDGYGFIRVAHEHAFSDFDFQVLRLDFGFLQNASDEGYKVLLAKLPCGEIDGDSHRRQTDALPSFDLSADDFQGPGSDRNDQAPVSSASGINKVGETKPDSGRCQRISASAPASCPVARFSLG